MKLDFLQIIQEVIFVGNARLLFLNVTKWKKQPKLQFEKTILFNI